MMRVSVSLLLTALVANANLLRAAPKTFLSGTICRNPPDALPKFCCKGVHPDLDYADTCECNPGWTHDECICKGYLMQMPCDHCMVHLPGTNRWLKSFSEKELYSNCDSCVTKCKSEFSKGDCKDFMGDIFKNSFPNSTPEKVLCTNDYLKSQVEQKDYPMNMKRELYRAPKYSVDNEYHQPSEWQVAGVG